VAAVPSEATEFVVDASVVAKWFKASEERDVRAARRIRRDYAAGQLRLVVPPLLFLEILNAAARRWRWQPARVTRLASRLAAIRLIEDQPPLGRVAHWCAQGLTAYDACYLALAERRHVKLVTDDAQLLTVGGALTRAL
jgi:predicted nucleic acid-binding protein